MARTARFLICVLVAAAACGCGGARKPEERQHPSGVTVKLGRLMRDLPGGRFDVEVGVILNPKLGVRMAHFRKTVQESWAVLRDVIRRDIVLTKDPADFHRDRFLETLSWEIRDRLNGYLGTGPGGVVIVNQVVYSRIHQLPKRRR
ncbi:MAG: hypothetical protein ACYTAF_03265 [Planctomycetota bacterium]